MKKAILVSTLVFFPYISNAQILLSEIAWMGTDSDANNEWIEIYNFSNTSADLAGWTLTSDDGALAISLAGVLPPHGVAVLERTDDTTLPGVTALLTYTGGLSNEGRILTIKDQNGVTSDEVIGGANWANIGGSNTAPKKTPQRTRAGSWVTAAPTPGTQNAEVDDEVIPDTTSETNTNTERKETTIRRSSGGGSAQKSTRTENENPVLALDIDAPNIAYVNEPITLSLEASGIGPTMIASLNYSWNFGDLSTDSGKIVSHKFEHPGTYIVYGEAHFAKQEAHILHEIDVLPTSLILSKTKTGDLHIANRSDQDIDVGGFKLVAIESITFPQHTYIKADGGITISRTQITGNTFSLFDASRMLVASLGAPEVQTVSQAPIATIQVVTKTVSEQISTAASIEKITEILPEADTVPQETVIEIGARVPTEREGFITRFFKRLGSFFEGS